MKSIGFKNFRKFVDFPPIDFNDITLMVGRNNSGKSTLVKSVLVILDFIKNGKVKFLQDEVVSFDSNSFYDVNIGTFHRALCNKAERGEISWTLSIGKFDFEISVVGDQEDKNSTMATLSKLDIYDNERNVRFKFDLSAHSSVIEFEAKSDSEQFLQEKVELTEELKALKQELKSNTDIARVDEIQQQIKLTENNLKLLKSNSIERELQTVQIPMLRDFGIANENIILHHIRNVIEYPAYNTDKSDKEKKDKRTKEYKDDMQAKAIITENIELLAVIKDDLYRVISSIAIDYIPAFDIKKSIYSSSKSSGDYMAETIHSFSKLKNKSSIDGFVRHWMKEMGIGVGFEIESFNGEVHTISVIDELGNSVYLADMGTGSVRLMILIMQLAIIIVEKGGYVAKSIVFIEEPELNLHPDLQARLADLFEDVNSRCGIRLMVETHSEYLIRKTQVIVANKGYKDEEALKDNKFGVYYFPTANTPYLMNYRIDGKFSNEFETGFFDEANNLIFEIL